MGYGRELPWLLAIAVCAAVPFYLGAYAFGSGSINFNLLAGALISLGCGLFVIFFLISSHTRMIQRDMRRLANEIASIIRETRDERRATADLAAQVSVMRSENQNLASTLSVSMNELRQNYMSLSSEMRGIIERQYQLQSMQGARPAAVHPSQWTNGDASGAPAAAAAQVAAPAPAPVAEPVTVAAGSLDQTPYADSLIVSLEPVIDLFSGKTAYYRMHYALGAAGTAEGSQDMMARHAERGDLRPGLDLHLARECLALLKRLRKRDARIGIFVPIGAATLGSPEALARLVQLHAAEPSVSDGMIVDVPHTVLANLPSNSLEGLAYLARSGVQMSLSNAAVAGLDLGALDKLNVRFVAISAGSVGSEPKQSAGIANFVQAARALHVQVIVTGVAAAQQATQLMRVARFASGSAFAEPRRVRRDVVGSDEFSAAAE